VDLDAGAATIRQTDDSQNTGMDLELSKLKISTGAAASLSELLADAQGTFSASRRLYTLSDTNIGFLGDTYITGNSGTVLDIGKATSSSGRTLNMNSSGTVTQSAAIATDYLSLSGGGTFNFISTGNNIITLAGNVKSFNLLNTGNLNIGSLGKADGLLAAGNITLRTTGDLNISGSAGIVSSGGDVTLATTGGNFYNFAGSTAVKTTGSGRWLIYSRDPANDNRGGLVGNFKQYNTSYDQAVQGFGSGFLYSLAPKITVALTGVVSKVYDGNNQAAILPTNYIVSGAIGTDTVVLNNPAKGNYSDQNVDVSGKKTVTVNSLSITASDGGKAIYGYELTGNSVNANIGLVSPKEVSAQLSGTVSKIYDGGTMATLTSANYTFSGLLGSDNVVAAGPWIGAYDSAGAGVGKMVSVSGISLGGVGVANYRLASNYTSGNIGSISYSVFTDPQAAAIVKAQRPVNKEPVMLNSSNDAIRLQILEEQ